LNRGILGEVGGVVVLDACADRNALSGPVVKVCGFQSGRLTGMASERRRTKDNWTRWSRLSIVCAQPATTLLVVVGAQLNFRLGAATPSRPARLKAFTIGAGVQHNDGHQPLPGSHDSSHPSLLHAFNAMVAYKFKLVGHEMRAQLNVKNLFDKRYREGADVTSPLRARSI